MEYQIVWSSNYADQVEAVNNYLSEGWEIQGGISIVLLKPDTGEGAEFMFAQAMTRVV